MTTIRQLNPNGIRQFKEYLQRLRGGDTSPPPLHLLADSDTSISLSTRAEIESGKFSTRLEAARYLTSALAGVDRTDIDHNSGLWSWLGLCFFNELCPPATDGSRKPRSDHRYVLPPVNDPDHFRHYYRHLLAGAFTVFRLHGEEAKVLLGGDVDRFDDFSEQLASRQEFVTNPGIVRAVDLLYFDPRTGRPKRGAASNKRKPGTLRRFIDVIQQFDLTYDLYSMSGDQITTLLPAEFAPWAVTPPASM